MNGPVVVAGGGIAGLSAALALADNGQRVIVCERDPAPSAEGAGLQLSPNASRHLRDWGVLEQLSASALRPKSVVVRRAADARVLVEMPLASAESRWGAPYLVAHRANLYEALLSAAASRPDIDLRFGTPVSGWDNASGFGVNLAGGSRLPAAALIVADGVRSSLRAAFAPQSRSAAHSGRVAWRALAASDAVSDFARAANSNLWLGRDAHLVHYPLRGGTVVNIVAVVSGAARVSEGPDFWASEGDPYELTRRFQGWDASARELLDAANVWKKWPLLEIATPAAFARGRVAIMGDAAHPMPPFLAQGAAQAIEDAAALASAWAGTDDPIAGLQTYSAKRHARAARIVEASQRQGSMYHLSGPAAFVRDTAMRAIGARGMMTAMDWIYRA